MGVPLRATRGFNRLAFIIESLHPVATVISSSDGRFGKKENDSIRFVALSEPPSTVHTRGSGLWS